MNDLPVALNFSGACSYTPRTAVFRPNGSAVRDKTHAVSTSNARRVADGFHRLDNRHQQACGARDRAVRCAEFVQLWLQLPNKMIRELALIMVHPGYAGDLNVEKIERWVANRRTADHQGVAGELPVGSEFTPIHAQIGAKTHHVKTVTRNFPVVRQLAATADLSNRVGNPEGYRSDGREIPTLFSPTGSLFSQYI